MQLEESEGEMEDITPEDRFLMVNGNAIKVQPSATILDLRDGDDSLIDFSEIDPGDQVQMCSFTTCSGDGGDDGIAFVILVVSAETIE